MLVIVMQSLYVRIKRQALLPISLYEWLEDWILGCLTSCLFTLTANQSTGPGSSQFPRQRNKVQ